MGIFFAEIALAGPKGKIIKLRKRKATVRFKQRNIVSVGQTLSVYKRKKKGRPAKLIGQITVVRVKGKKVYGTLEKTANISNRKFKKGVVRVDALEGGGGGSPNFVVTAPRIVVNPGFMYGINSANLYVLTEDLQTDATKTGPIQDITMLTFGADAALYPIGFAGSGVLYSIFGLGVSYWTGSGTPIARVDPTIETTEEVVPTNADAVVDANQYMYEHITADVRLRYADYITPSFYMAIIGKFNFFDRFRFGEVGIYDEFTAMSAGGEIRMLIANMVQIGGFFELPILSKFFNAQLRDPAAQDAAALVASQDAGAEAGTVPLLPTVEGYKAGGFLGIRYRFFTIQGHFTMDRRNYMNYTRFSDDAIEFGSYSTLQMGAKIGIEL